MRITPLITVLVLTTIAARASEIDNAAAAIAGTEASFTQRFTPKGFKNSQVESGSVVFGKLPLMRWTYTQPESKVFVFDGSHSWFYVAVEKQVTVATIDDRRKSELPFLLIGDPAARERLFAVHESSRGGTTLITLQPRDPSATIRNVTLTVAPATHVIERLEYSDREGNRTAFEFSGFHRRPMSPDLFRFVPPPGVEVVNAP